MPTAFENINSEIREKAKACKTSEELLALAKEEVVELSEEELDTIAGGWGLVPTTTIARRSRSRR